MKFELKENTGFCKQHQMESNRLRFNEIGTYLRNVKPRFI